MIILKTEIVIFAFLFFASFTITECKRGGGGGRIFRATVLKERRNSRRPRDLHEQLENQSQWDDSMVVSSKLLDDIFETYNPSNYDENAKPVDRKSSFAFIDQLSDYQASEQDTESMWQGIDDKNTETKRNNDNIRDNDEIVTSMNHHSHDYVNDEVQKSQRYVPIHREEYSNTEKTNTEHYYKSMEKGDSDPNENHNKRFANFLLHYLFRARKSKKFNYVSSQGTDNLNEWNSAKKPLMPKSSLWNVVFGFPRYPYSLQNSKLIPIVPCQKDFSSFCPFNTVPLCSNNGKVLCAVFKQQNNVVCNQELHVRSMDLWKHNDKEAFSVVVRLPYTGETVMVAKPSGSDVKSTTCVTRVVLLQSNVEDDQKFMLKDKET